MTLSSAGTAVTNSRADSQPEKTLRVDYLAIHYVGPRDVIDGIADLWFTLGVDTIDWSKVATNSKYGRVWDFGYWSKLGGRYLVDQGESGPAHGCLVLKGETLGAYSVDALRRNLIDPSIAPYFSHCSRCDLALDFDPVVSDLRKEIRGALDRGAVSGVKTYCWHESRTVGESDAMATLEIGSRDSDAFARIYDKLVDGFHSCRFEVELKRDLANLAIAAITESDLAVSDFYNGCLARWQFYCGEKTKNLARNKVIPLWAAFCKRAKPIRVAKPKELPTVERATRWLTRQVAKTLAKLKEIFPAHQWHETMTGLVENGLERLTQSDLNFCQRQKHYYIYDAPWPVH